MKRTAMNRILGNLFPGLAILMLLMASPDAGAARENAMTYLRPLMDRGQYSTFCQKLQLNSDQRQIVDLMFNDYLGSIEALFLRVDAEAIQAGQRQIDQVFAGNLRMHGTDLQALRAKVYSIYVQCGPGADRLFHKFTIGIDGIMRPEQADRFQGAVRELRRSLRLHRYQIGSKFFNYAGEGVDVLQLAEAAREIGGELSELDDPALQAQLDEYELRLDELLQSGASDYRDQRLMKKIAKIQAAYEEEGLLGIQMLDYWGKLYTLNRDTVNRIGEILTEQKGEWAKQLWNDRFRRAQFPWQFHPLQPDRYLDWIRSNLESPDLQQEAELKYSLYLAERDALQREMISLLIEARLERGIELHQLTSLSQVENVAEDLYQTMLRNSGSLSNLETRHKGELEELLDEAQRDEMRVATLPRRQR
ncbi:MAG: hypothetical protein O7G85_02725 [Planctomycetota bacterium]|nr:hypothetical protein [Planctomycetota bacterium]